MINIKLELKNVIEKTMIPESKAFLKELNETINNNPNSEDLDVKKDMMTFLEELEVILDAINKDEISDEQAADIYEKIIFMLEEHGEED